MSASGIYLTRRQFWGMFVLTPALTFVAMIMLLVVMNRRSALAGAYAGGDDDAQVLREGRLLAEVRHIVRTRYVDDVEPDQLLYGALHGMVGSLDAVSEFMPPATYREEKIDTLGRFGGLGIEVVLQDGWLTVLSPIEGTPAHAAGVLAGDRIVAIDGVSTEGFTVPDAAKRLRGKPGTSVTITVVHEGTKRRVDITIERAEIRVKTVRGAHLADTARGIGYLRIAQFADATADEFDTAVNELRTQGLKALVVDLRWNPGGLLRQGVGVADRFLASGAIVSVRSRASAPEIYAAQAGTTTLPDMPVVVLVNGRSASSAEIVGRPCGSPPPATTRRTGGPSSRPAARRGWRRTSPWRSRASSAPPFGPTGCRRTSCGATGRRRPPRRPTRNWTGRWRQHAPRWRPAGSSA
ncbi:MAG: S41 family peptidase [Planctomycetota bacterium]|jgi:carboxyl-terminal processing protease